MQAVLRGALDVAQSATWSPKIIGLKGRTSAAGTSTLPSMGGRSKKAETRTAYVSKLRDPMNSSVNPIANSWRSMKLVFPCVIIVFMFQFPSCVHKTCF